MDTRASTPQGWDHGQHILATSALFCDLFRFYASCLWSRCFLGWSLLTLEESYAFWPVGFLGHSCLACSDCLFFFFFFWLGFLASQSPTTASETGALWEKPSGQLLFSVYLFIEIGLV